MKISYLACMYDSKTYEKLFVLDYKPMQAAGKYHILMCEGLIQNNVIIDTIAILPINSRNYSKKICKNFQTTSEGVVFNFLPIFNLRFLKQIMLFFHSFFRMLRANTTHLVYDYLNLSASKGALLAAKIRKIKTTCIVTDLPDYLFTSKIYIKMYYKVLLKADSFVFLTKKMNERINIKKKPYIILEGHSNSKMNIFSRKPDLTKKIVLYAGLLEEKYGVIDMCKGFQQVCKDDEELHIFGDGTCKKNILYFSKYDSRIKYFGSVPNSIVMEAEGAATLLLNPRPSNDIFTHFSFPSKTIEYMSTGTPVLMYSLPGIPEEYLKYVFIIEDGNPINEIGKSIRRVLDLPIEELNTLGEKAKLFVLTEKNNVVQSNKLLSFISSI